MPANKTDLQKMAGKALAALQDIPQPVPVTEQALAACIAASGFFNADFYLEEYPDVANADIDPALHYVRYGFRECRKPAPMDAVPYSGSKDDAEWLKHAGFTEFLDKLAKSGGGTDVGIKLEEVKNNIKNSNNNYIKYQKERIFYTIELAKKENIYQNAKHVLNIGGGGWSLFNELWRLSFPETQFISSEGDLHDKLPYQENEFDGALFTEVFEHIGDRNFLSSTSNFHGIITLCSEITRVIKPGCLCYLTTPNARVLLNR